MKRLLATERYLFEQKNRYLLLYITLAYKIEYRADVTLERVKRDLFQFLHLTAGRRLFKDIKGYAWKIELGEYADNHFHIHMLVWYDGLKHGDIYYSLELCKAWEELTGGKGYGKSSNYDKSVPNGCDYRVLGTIDKSNLLKRNGLMPYYEYLVKDTQRVSTFKKEKLFSCSRSRDKKKKIDLLRPSGEKV